MKSHTLKWQICAIFAGAFLFFYGCQTTPTGPRPQSADYGSPSIRVISSTPEGLKFMVRVPPMAMYTEKTKSGEFQRLVPGKLNSRYILSGNENFSRPEVPVYTVHLALPLGAKPGRVNIKPFGEGDKTSKIKLFPVQKEQFTSSEKEEQQEFPFEFNEGIYKQANSTIAEIRTYRPFLQNEENICKLSLNLVDYDPGQELLTRYDSFQVSIDFGVKDPAFRKEFKDNGKFKRDDIDLYRYRKARKASEFIINPDVFDVIVGVDFAPIRLGADLLIVTHPDFLDAANDLRSHKNARGIRTSVVTTQTISDRFGDGSGNVKDTEVKEYVRDFYQNSLQKIQWLLLLGDAEFIPPHYIEIWANSARCSGDQYYGQLNDDNFELPWYGIGRIPVDDLQTAQLIVDRIKAFENEPPSTFNRFYYDLTFATQFQDDEKDSIANRRFAETSEDIRSYLTTQNMQVERIYKTNNDVFPKYWLGGAPIPADLLKPGFPWDGDRQDIKDAVNAGTSILYHRDHGSKSGWGTPGFNMSDLDDLVISGNEYPLVFSVNCASGVFDNETANLPENGGSMNVNVNSTYWAEKFLRQENGALALVCDTRNSSTWRNNEMAKGLFDALWPDFEPFGPATEFRSLGQMLNHAKGYVDAGGGSDSAVYKENTIYNLLGDPSVSVQNHRPWYIADLVWEPLTKDRLIHIKVDVKIPECPKCPLERMRPEFPEIFAVLMNPKTGEPIARGVFDAKGNLKLPIGDFKGNAILNLSGDITKFEPKEYQIK